MGSNIEKEAVNQSTKIIQNEAKEFKSKIFVEER